MESEKIFDTLLKIIASIKPVNDNIKGSYSLDKFEFDSIQIFILYVQIEDAFHVVLDPQKFCKETTLDEIVGEIIEKQI